MRGIGECTRAKGWQLTFPNDMSPGNEGNMMPLIHLLGDINKQCSENTFLRHIGIDCRPRFP